MLRSSAAREVSVLRGQDAHLKMVVCADPKPTKVQWHWGSLAVDSGANSGRFQAEELLQVREYIFFFFKEKGLLSAAPILKKHSCLS